MRMTLRFVSGKDALSLGIRARCNSPWSHVEAVAYDKSGNVQGYLGAHADGGVQLRPVGYDAKWLDHDLFVELPETYPGQGEDFRAALDQHIGEPYDFGAILDFIIPDIEAHQQAHAICSALQALELRACKWFATPLSEPAHRISPRDLLAIVSGRVPVSL
jgi:hypothetical protein